VVFYTGSSSYEMTINSILACGIVHLELAAAGDVCCVVTGAAEHCSGLW